MHEAHSYPLFFSAKMSLIRHVVFSSLFYLQKIYTEEKKSHIFDAGRIRFHGLQGKIMIGKIEDAKVNLYSCQWEASLPRGKIDFLS